MARTLHNRMTGRAAATQRAEDREHILSMGAKVDLGDIRARLKKKETDSIARCIALEGKISFYTWYANVDGSISGRVELIEARIAKLEEEARYTIVDNLLGQEGAHPLAIMDAAELIQLGEPDPGIETKCKHDFPRGWDYPCSRCGEKLEEFPY